MTKALSSVLMEYVSRDRLTRMYVSSLPASSSFGKQKAIPVSGGREHTVSAEPGGHTSCYYLRQLEQVHVFARVRLSVCLLARLLKNACVDLHEMLHVDRCRDTDN